MPSPFISPGNADVTTGPADLDTSEELALRSLLLGIVHRTAGEFASSRAFLEDTRQREPDVETSTWMGAITMFELAVLDLKETEAAEKLSKLNSEGSLSAEETRRAWIHSLKSATDKLDQALALATGSIDLSSRLDSRIAMLRDEMSTKKEMLGLS